MLRQVKGERPSCVAIMLTNYPYPQYRKRCLAAGAEFFFDKSTEFEKVIHVLEQLCEDRQGGSRDARKR